MTNTQWTYESWADVERLASELATITFELSEHIGAGGGAVSGFDIKVSISQIEAALFNLKQTVANYN